MWPPEASGSGLQRVVAVPAPTPNPFSTESVRVVPARKGKKGKGKALEPVVRSELRRTTCEAIDRWEEDCSEIVLNEKGKPTRRYCDIHEAESDTLRQEYERQSFVALVASEVALISSKLQAASPPSSSSPRTIPTSIPSIYASNTIFKSSPRPNHSPRSNCISSTKRFVRGNTTPPTSRTTGDRPNSTSSDSPTNSNTPVPPSINALTNSSSNQRTPTGYSPLPTTSPNRNTLPALPRPLRPSLRLALPLSKPNLRNRIPSKRSNESRDWSCSSASPS